MITTLRAALSVLMLIGFYVFALAIVGALGVVSVLLWQEHAGPGAAKIAFFTLAVGAGIVAALWRVMRAKTEPLAGIPVEPSQAPQLWQTVRELAATAETRVPDEIVLIPMVNAAVSEDARLLGLLGGRRRLYLGVPLLQALTVAQLRSVLAHELGHYSRQHTRFGEIAYRGRLAILTTAEATGAVISWILMLYGKLYFLVEAGVSRRQELEADQLSVRAAGRGTAQGALRELPVVEAAWGFYEGRYIDPGWEAGYAPLPSDFFLGFGRLLAARTDELASLRAEAPPSKQSTWDSHPSIATRVAAMQTMPDTAVHADQRTASDLLPMFENACAALAVKTVRFGDRRQLPWDEFTGVSTLVQEQRRADLIYRTAARLVGVPEAGLGTVFDLVAAGRLGELASEFFPNATRRESAGMFAEPMELLLRVAAVRSNVAQWRHSWSGSPALIGPTGRTLPLEEVAALAVAPDTLGTALGRLAALGINVEAAIQVDKVATAHGGDLLGGLANVEVNGFPHDLLILDNGLILTPCPKDTDGGKRRLAAFAGSAPVAELAKNNIFVPFEDVVSAKIVKNVPIRVALTMRSGQVVAIHEAWSGDRLTKQSADTLRELVLPFVPAETPSAR